MNLFTLKAVLGIDTSQYEKGLDQSKNKAKSFGGAVKSGLVTAGKMAAGTVAAVAGAATAAGVAITKTSGEVAQYGDSIDKNSQKMGISAKAYQEWDHILQHSGASISTMKTGMKTLSNAVQRGDDSFQKLGLTQEQVASMSQEELFGAVINGLQNMESGTERTALASKLLGRGAIELGALLNTSAEDTEKMRQRVHELGGVMSDEAVKASAHYQDSLQDLQTSMEGLKRNTVSEFLPGMVTVMDGLASIFAGEEGGVAKVTEGVDNIISKVGEVVPKFVEIVGNIAQSLGTAIMDNLPQITEFLVQGALSISQFMLENAPVFIETAGTILSTVLTTLGENVQPLLDTALDLITKFAEGLPEGIPKVVEKAMQVITGMSEGMKGEGGSKIIDVGLKLIMSLIQGIANAVPILLQYLPTIIGNIAATIITNLPKILHAGSQLIDMLWNGVNNSKFHLLEGFGKICIAVIDAVKKVDWLKLGKDVINILAKGAMMMAFAVPKIFEGIAKEAFDALAEVDWADVGENIINGIVNGISDFASNLVDAAVQAAEDAIDAVKNWLGIASPSKRARDEIGKWMALGVGAGWEKYMPVSDMSDTMQNALDDISAVPSVPDEEFVVTTSNNNADKSYLLNALLNLLQMYLPILADNVGNDIVLDSGVLVGQLVPQIDRGLGNLSRMRERGL